MAVNTADYSPKPRTWFVENVTYEGQGRAEFADPEGWVEGFVRIKFDILGQASIEMDVDGFHNSHRPDDKYAFERLLSGQKPEVEIKRWMTTYPGPKNRCTTFTVQGDDFAFNAIGQVEYDYLSSMVSRKIEFRCWQSHVIFHSTKVPKYWVMPLCNFVSDYGLFFTDLDNHPLRQYIFPEIPENLSEQDKQVAHWNQRAFNALIRFEYEGKFGYIEALPDYPNKKRGLTTYSISYAMTAIMNCEIGEQSTELSELWEWFPIQFLDLLSLATGSRVSAPWIEFRDEEGDLVSRLHIR